ncbi:hypothetical protein [Coxiella-like endosymbiont]|uniref:hypothetical protein n=1 Tax=Coxiella-like endosymbiont TaxID=1592897 RepID=UPI002729913A|nr:hypothetical protein [Coxiella-like endosymbiont]
MEDSQLYLVLEIIFSFFMDCGVGANDVANVMGTSIGLKAITITQAYSNYCYFRSSGIAIGGRPSNRNHPR